MRTKRYFYDRIVLGLQDAYPNIDWNIQPREVFLAVDDIVNSLAKQNAMENWKMGGLRLDEAFVTTWSGETAISVVDVDNQPSYLVLPAQCVALPNDAGVVEIWPENYEYGAVRIMMHQDVRRTRRLMSGNLQGELGGYRKGINFEFNQVDVGKNFASTFGVRLAIKDSTAISETAPYPIPADLEGEIIQLGIEFFSARRFQATDTIRDKQDAIKRN
jgi:hypothetical protein